MEPFTSAILFGAGSWVVNKLIERRKAAKAVADGTATAAQVALASQQPLLEPHRYPLPVVERFTEKKAQFGGVPVVSFFPRHVRGLRAELARRSVVQVPISLDPPDGPASPYVVNAWHVVPRAPRALSALVLVDNAVALGATVVASHSLFWVADPNLTAPIVLLVGDHSLTRLAAPGGQFAVLPGNKVTVTVPAEVVSAPAPAPAAVAPVVAPAPVAPVVSGVSGIGRGTPEQTTAAPSSPATPSGPVAESPPPPAKPRRRRRPLAKAKSAKSAKSAGAKAKSTVVKSAVVESNGKSRRAIHADENGAPVLLASDLISGEDAG